MSRTRATAMRCFLTVAALAPTVAPVLAAHPAQAIPAASGSVAVGRSAVAQPPAGMLAALQRDLDLTAEQARSRLLNEVRFAPIAEQLRRRLGDRFAGAWLLEPAAQALVVATTSRGDAAQIIDQGARPFFARRSLADLRAIKDRLAARPAVSSVSAVRYADVRTNKVVVSSATPQAAENAIKAAGLASEAVRVIASAERPRLLPTDPPPPGRPTDLVGGQAYYAGTATRCSVGFSVIRGDQKGFVSAGHCGTPGTATVGFNQGAQGVVQASTFPGADHSWVAVNGAWLPRPLVGNDSGGTMRVRGSRPAVEGASVCLSGSSGTGRNWRCGTITQRDVDVTYPKGIVNHLIRTSACGDLGDSGASMLSVDQAQGVVSGGSGGCATDGVTYVQPIGEILTAYDLTLITHDRVPLHSTGGCTGYPHIVTGTLNDTRSAHQPGDRFYRTTTAGDHHGCLDSDAGRDFDLYLQKRTGSGWKTVATSNSPNTLEELSYRGSPGDYRYLVLSSSGAGPYILGYTTP
ncbi:S1 family peptidase [Streptosporangium sp. NPDC048865]|uniref:S1 family peptidase n=1 Tax=Streptosporangium sp. NPDC048865 TaxID=3155766 RepID=UPI003435D0E5